MKTAIILAAGIGSRLMPLTEDKPKSCVKVNGEEIIKKIVSQLIKFQSEIKIYVVIGHFGNEIKKVLSDFEEYIVYVENENYKQTNNMESCRLALDARTESSGSLIINADCIYDDEIIQAILERQTNTIAADIGRYEAENMKIKFKDSRVEEISKEIKPGESVATSIDLYFFTEKTLNILRKIMNSFKEVGMTNLWNEVAIDAALKKEVVEFIDISGLRWMEIDNHEDLKIAVDLFK